MEPLQEATGATAADLGALLDAGEGAIVTLVAGETRLAAYRAVLAARSPVFAAMFAHDTLEASSGVVSIPDVEGAVLRQLLAYLYTLQAPQLPGMAAQLLAAADKYGLTDLKAECEKQVAAQLSVETAAATAVLAVRHSCDSLSQAAIQFLKNNFVEVAGTQGWADAIVLHPDHLIKVSRLLSAPSPETSSRREPPRHQAAAAASAAPTAAAPGHSAPPEDAALSRLRSLSEEEKGRRLIQAASARAVEELESLLAAGADVAARDGDSRTALHRAAAEGRVKAARRLLAAGAAVEARDRWQSTALHLAAWQGRAAVARLLLAASAYHSARNQGGWTPLHCAAEHGRREVAAALLEAGADRAARTNRGETPLDVARERNHQQLVDLLTTAS